MSRDSKRASKDDELALLEKISDANESAGSKYLEHLVLRKRSQVNSAHIYLRHVTNESLS